VETDILGWIATVMTYLGFVGLARKKVWGLVLFASSDVIWAAVGVLTELNSLVTLSSSLVVLNLWAAYCWSTHDNN